MQIRRLTPTDAAAYQALRLQSLRASPGSFSSSVEEEQGTPLATIAEHLSPASGRNMLGAFVEQELVGMVGLGRVRSRKEAHKAVIRSMAVAEAHRGKGIGRQLMTEVLALARTMPGLRQVNLVVTVRNTPAVALYQSLGFTAFGMEPDSLLVGDVLYDDLHMVLRLGER